MPRGAVAILIVAATATYAGAATVRVVCPADNHDATCAFSGNNGIQQAVDAAGSGDTILIRAGIYSPEAFRDVPFEKLLIRGYVVADGKNIEIAGEPGAILDGGTGKPASAIVTRGGQVTIRDLVVRNFQAGDPEDDTYDGHGLFFIDTHATVKNVTIQGVRKMALTGRGSTEVDASGLSILDGHVGIWLEETARLSLRDALVRGNESAGICAYGKSSATIAGSTFEKNHDDGVYAEGDATIEVRNSKVTDNEPRDVHAVGNARILVDQPSTTRPSSK